MKDSNCINNWTDVVGASCDTAGIFLRKQSLVLGIVRGKTKIDRLTSLPLMAVRCSMITHLYTKMFIFWVHLTVNDAHLDENYDFLSCDAATLRGLWPPHTWSLNITHNDAQLPIGLLSKSNQLVAENSTWTHTTLTRVRHPCPRQDSNPQFQQASDRRPTS
jgi:hypothetical protein